MRLNPLSFRVVVLSWLVALAVWPLTWVGLAAAQGVGALIAGGGWIGIAVPLGAHPLGLVNEPTVAFASSRAALWLYWLAPALAALAVSAAAPPLAPAPPGWLGELAVFHAAAAAAVLGLGWAPPLGAADGPAAGLLRFWGWRPGVLEAVAAGAGAVTIQLAVARLAGHLWSEPGGPRRSRRLLVTIVHGFAPVVGWAAAVIATGWAVTPRALVTAGAVMLGALAGAWHWTPRSPLHRNGPPGWAAYAGTAVLGIGIALFVLWAGSPARGSGRALLWGKEGLTSNVRAAMETIRLTPPHAPRTPPAR
ncbi:MAG TPA: hypothetical protein VLW17_08985 [Thermoanaerobaculaceae bacterium]|nr:hypothetical protein [Thermoanaerobaculaceae bacterium]